MVSLNSYLLVSGLLFAIGLTGVLVRRSVIVILMCLEIMLSAANLALVAFSRFRLEAGLPDYDGQVLVFFVITVAAAEVGIGLAIVLMIFRNRRSANVDEFNLMKW